MVLKCSINEVSLVSLTTARPVNTAQLEASVNVPKAVVNTARPKAVLIKPALGFMRPFRCPDTILNTIDHLGKFDGKTDEGFFVGENTPNIAGSGPNWLFDIDALTKSMNYKPVVAGNQSNGNAGTKACDDAGKARMETIHGQDYILLPFYAVGEKASIELPDDPNMHALEDIVYLDDDEDVSDEVDLDYLELFLHYVRQQTTPLEYSKPLLKDEDGEEMDVYLYRSLIGSLMYLTSLRPDIMFAVCACARYQVNPKVSHLHAMKMIFSDYARASLDRKSTTGGCQFLGCRLISWQCKKQTVVANSTTEAEYVVASSCCGQVLWIQNQLFDYGMLYPLSYIIFRIEQFWATVKAKTVNGEVQLQALVDGKKIIITESIVRRDLQLEDAKGVDCTCGELDAFVSIPDEGDMDFLRKKVKSGAAVGKRVLVQVIKAKDLELGTRRKLRLRMNFVKTLDFHSSKTMFLYFVEHLCHVSFILGQRLHSDLSFGMEHV
ncbi:hypothetical protein Tco_0612986 [Tanacetum coccineum]